eukprot:scaffold362_cov176-Amphora_coffeaeformis.AAC.18
MMVVSNSIDVDKLVERSNLEAIVARSSSGIFQQIVDLIRIQIVRLDMFLHRLSRCKCRDKEIYLPPVPKPKKKKKHGGRPSLANAASQKLSDRVVEVQGAYSGVVSRTCLYAIDETVTLTTFGLASLLVEGIAQLIPGNRTYEIHPILLAATIVVWGVNIRLVSLLACRRTLGMAFVGVMLVNIEGRRPKWWQIVIRQFLQPIFSFPVINAVSMLFGWVRSDGRFPHDLLTRTGVVYSWNVRISMLRLSHRKRLEDRHNECDSNEEFDGLYP